jgi:hypothetical protein
MRHGRAIAVGLLLAAGCSAPDTHPAADREPVYPVRGFVFVDGRPAAGATIALYPERGFDGPVGVQPRAVVRADGSFELGTYRTGDGAPAGHYVVTVVWAGGDAGHRDRLGGLYADPAVSKLTTAVLHGPNVLPPFRLDGSPLDGSGGVGLSRGKAQDHGDNRSDRPR